MAEFRSIVSEFDGSDELAQAQREALEALQGMAEANRALFEKEIHLLILDAGSGTDRTIPISRVLRTDGMARAYLSSNAQQIPDTLKTAVSGFIEGGSENIVTGIFDILGEGLQIFLGSTEGRAESIKQYFVYCNELAIYRVDLMAWSRAVQADSLKTKIEQATAYAYCISNVDITKIAWQDFVAIYALQLDRVKTLSSGERERARARMIETWNFLQGPTPRDLATADRMTFFEEIEATYALPLTSR